MGSTVVIINRKDNKSEKEREKQFKIYEKMDEKQVNDIGEMFQTSKAGKVLFHLGKAGIRFTTG